MKGRSADQVAAYEARLDEVRALLAAGPMTVREIREALAAPEPGVGDNGRGSARVPAAATVYARIRALEARGVPVQKRKRREKVPGKSGHRERVFSVDGE